VPRKRQGQYMHPQRTSSLALTLQPASRRRRATSACPPEQASKRGVLPLSFRSSLSAPARRRRRTAAGPPSFAALCSAELPSCPQQQRQVRHLLMRQNNKSCERTPSRALTNTPARSSCSMVPTSPASAALKSLGSCPGDDTGMRSCCSVGARNCGERRPDLGVG
jgi:hypothetical protein